jgi:DNA-binding NarL/FixJ family response regulator
LVVLDLAMPRLNGMEAAAVLKNLMPRTAIVMLTFHDDQIKAVPASAFGIKAVISKADGMSKLIECLDGLLGREVQPPDSMSKDKPSANERAD